MNGSQCDVAAVGPSMPSRPNSAIAPACRSSSPRSTRERRRGIPSGHQAISQSARPTHRPMKLRCHLLDTPDRLGDWSTGIRHDALSDRVSRETLRTFWASMVPAMTPIQGSSVRPDCDQIVGASYRHPCRRRRADPYSGVNQRPSVDVDGMPNTACTFRSKDEFGQSAIGLR